jgi:hypothetical protein
MFAPFIASHSARAQHLIASAPLQMALITTTNRKPHVQPYLTEFDQLVITSNGVPPFGKLDATTKLQTVTIGGSASAAFQPTTKFVRLVADATCIVSYTPPGGEAVEVAFLGSDLKGECFGVDPFGTISAATAS